MESSTHRRILGAHQVGWTLALADELLVQTEQAPVIASSSPFSFLSALFSHISATKKDYAQKAQAFVIIF